MKKLLKSFVPVVSLFLFWSITSLAAVPPMVNNAPMPSISGMLKKAMPAVVNIYVQGELPPTTHAALGEPSPNGPGPGKPFQDVGSGVIVDAKNGLVITNAHVVKYQQIIQVTLSDGRHYKGQLLGADNPSDIAVIKINAPDLIALPFANSDKAQVGDFVVAIGSPFGLLNQTVTSGVISAMNRTDLGIEGYENFIQTDASINPGNSGGALVNINGQLVGINTAILSPAGGNVGIGFAIPSNMAKSVMEQLIQYGKVERGLLGVFVQDLTPDLADALNAHDIKGALITQVSPGSPAAKAGLQEKDIVEEINGVPIENGAQLRNSVGLTRVGSKMTLKVLRNNKILSFTATLATKKEAFSGGTSSFLAGVRLRGFDELGFNTQEVKGVQVLDLDPNSPAALKGLRPGDVILSANDQAVNSVAQLSNLENNNQKRLLLEIKRLDGGDVFVVIDNN